MAAGSGIGLTIVAELVRAQHATLHISSESGKGTRAIITFPGAKKPEPGRRYHQIGKADGSGVGRTADAGGEASQASQARPADEGPMQPQGSAASSI